MLFLRPTEVDAIVCAAILDDFGEASRLRINQSKCVILQIRCTSEHEALVSVVLGSPVGGFPCRYMGLPLCLRKHSAAQFHEIVESFHSKLPIWRTMQMDKSVTLVLVQSVLCAMPIMQCLRWTSHPKLYSLRPIM